MNSHSSRNAPVAIQRFEHSKALPAPRFHYCPAIQVGTDVYISGLVGINPNTGALADSTAIEQTRQIFQNLQSLCVEQGWSLDRIVLARVYCAGSDSIQGMNEAWNEFFSDLPPPVRSFALVQGLPLDAAVEIEFQLSI